MTTTRRRPATHAVVATDGVGRIRAWDAGAVAMFGPPSDEVIGRRIAEIVAADTSTTVSHQVMAATLRGEGWSGMLAVRPAGDSDATLICHVTALPATDEDGRLICVV